MRISDWSSDVCSSDLTAIADDPCEGAFDDPSSGMDDEAGLIGEFADDFDRNGGGVPDAIAVVGAVGIGARDEGMPLVRLLEKGHRAIAVLHIGRIDRKSVVTGKSVSGRVDLGGGRSSKKKN